MPVEEGDCLKFGSALVQNLTATTKGAEGFLQALIGADARGGPVVSLMGHPVDQVDLDLGLYPKKDEGATLPGSGGSADECESGLSLDLGRLNVTVGVKIGRLDLNFHEGDGFIRPPAEIRSGDYIFLTDRQSPTGGAARISNAERAQIAFEGAGSALMRGHVLYEQKQPGPLEFLWEKADASGVRLSVRDLPSTTSLRWNLEGPQFYALGNLSEPVGEIRFTYRPKKEECASDPGSIGLTMGAMGIPAGQLLLGVHPSVAGKGGFYSEGGPIASVDAGVASFRDPTKSFSLAFRNVRIIANWDMDGDTRYESNPWHFFLTTGGAPLGQSSLRMRWGSWGVGLASNELMLDELQIRWYVKEVLLVPIPQLNVAGRACAAVSQTVEVMWSDVWRGFPMDVSAPPLCKLATFPFSWGAW